MNKLFIFRFRKRKQKQKQKTRANLHTYPRAHTNISTHAHTHTHTHTIHIHSCLLRKPLIPLCTYCCINLYILTFFSYSNNTFLFIYHLEKVLVPNPMSCLLYYLSFTFINSDSLSKWVGYLFIFFFHNHLNKKNYKPYHCPTCSQKLIIHIYNPYTYLTFQYQCSSFPNEVCCYFFAPCSKLSTLCKPFETMSFYPQI
jgi:hypothetical protein